MSEQIEARLRTLEDREAIRELVASYGPMADSSDAQGIAALFTEQGCYSVGGMGDAVGRSAIAALIEGAMHQQLVADGCAHLLGPVTIAVDGDSATARGHSVVLRNTGVGFEVFRVSANRWHFARGADGWRIIRRDNALLDGAEAARALFSPPAGRHQS